MNKKQYNITDRFVIIVPSLGGGMKKTVWGSVFFVAVIVAVVLVGQQVLSQKSPSDSSLEESDVLFIG